MMQCFKYIGGETMLKIDKTENGTKTIFKLEGKLDTITAPELEKELEDSLDGVEELIFDFTGIEYISSAGLRVILNTQQQMLEQGEMKLVGVNEIIMDIFEVTGFVDILTIEG